MSILDRINLSHKFTILGVILLLTAAVPTTFFILTVTDERQVAEQELAGTTPIIALQRVVQFTQQHRGVSAGMLGGNESLAARLPVVRAELNKAIDTFDATLKEAGASTQIESHWGTLKQRLYTIGDAVANRQLNVAESTAQHTQTVSGMLLVSEELLDEFGLSLDPEAATYFLMSATMVNAPKLAENMGLMRAVGAGFLTAGNLPPEGRAKLGVLKSNINTYFAELTRNMEKVLRADDRLRTELGAITNEMKAKIEKTLAMTNQHLLNAQELKLSGTAFFDEYTATIDNLYAFNATASGNLVDELSARSAGLQQSLYIVYGFILFGLIAIIQLSIVFVRSITNPLHEAISVADAVASGDLTSRINSDATNETGQLLQALRKMNDNLVDLVGKVRTGTDSISTASGEIASGNSDLSQRTEEQASSLEETASSMEELTSTVRQNSDNARQANQLAVGASEVAVKGGAVVGQVVQTMSSINESSKKIVDIISVIDGIAFQTNILALNAAVEAARAGEQGRGFAVVATEVRTLAQRSAAAAKEINELISDSVSKVEDGTKLVDEAGTTMDEIVNAVQRVTDIMSEISAASQEQSSGIEQVNQAVTQMDEVTQQNAALVEEAAAAAESMQDQAQGLSQAVTMFKLSGGMAPTLVKNSDRKKVITKLPDRGVATKAAAEDIESVKPRKAVSGSSDDSWEEF